MQIPKTRFDELFCRAAGRCECTGDDCGKEFKDTSEAEVHLIDKDKPVTLENCQLLCKECHDQKECSCECTNKE